MRACKRSFESLVPSLIFLGFSWYFFSLFFSLLFDLLLLSCAGSLDSCFGKLLLELSLFVLGFFLLTAWVLSLIHHLGHHARFFPCIEVLLIVVDGFPLSVLLDDASDFGELVKASIRIVQHSHSDLNGSWLLRSVSDFLHEHSIFQVNLLHSHNVGHRIVSGQQVPLRLLEEWVSVRMDVPHMFTLRHVQLGHLDFDSDDVSSHNFFLAFSVSFNG